MSLVLTAELFWHSKRVTENDYTYRQRTKYKAGDSLDDLTEPEQQRLRDLGVAVDSDDPDAPDEGQDTPTEPSGNITSRADGGVTPEGERLMDTEEGEDLEEGSDDSDDVDDVYSGWSRTELQGEATNRGLSSSGNKRELAQRLREDDANSPSE